MQCLMCSMFLAGSENKALQLITFGEQVVLDEMYWLLQHAKGREVTRYRWRGDAVPVER